MMLSSVFFFILYFHVPCSKLKSQFHTSLTETDKASPVSGAVHWLESEGLLLGLEGKHVLTVVLPVARGLPQFAVVDVGCHDLLETPLPVLALPKTEQCFLTKSTSLVDLHQRTRPHFGRNNHFCQRRGTRCSIAENISLKYNVCYSAGKRLGF